MKTNKIENRSDLRAEIYRLKLAAREQEDIINRNLNNVRESLRPENVFRSFISRFLGIDPLKKGTLYEIMKNAISLYLKRVFAKTEYKAEEKIFDFLDTAIERIRNYFKKK